MSTESDIASLRAEVARLAAKQQQPPPQSKDDPRIGQLEQRIQQLQTWVNTLRGSQGNEVRGNVITGPNNPTVPVITAPTTDVLVAGCLNGSPAVGLALYRTTPYPYPP